MQPDDDWESFVISNPGFITYQLLIKLVRPQSVIVGRLGSFEFPAGFYIYTGSARKNLVARVKRHLSRKKTLRWHVDYFLDLKDSIVVELYFSDRRECDLNRQSRGEVLFPGFGASDCRAECGSHLKYLGENN